MLNDRGFLRSEVAPLNMHLVLRLVWPGTATSGDSVAVAKITQQNIQRVTDQ